MLYIVTEMNLNIGTYKNPDRTHWLGWVSNGTEVVFIGLDNRFSKPYKDRSV